MSDITIKIDSEVLDLLRAIASDKEDYSAVIKRILTTGGNTKQSRRAKRWYLVVSPEMTYGEGIMDPVEPYRDVALVYAPTRKEARWGAYRLWKRTGSDWIDKSKPDSIHPLDGVTIQQEWTHLSEDEIKEHEPFVERM